MGFSQSHNRAVSSIGFLLLLGIIFPLLADTKATFLKIYDLDNNNAVSFREFKQVARQRFNSIDGNNDQSIDNIEFKNWQQHLQQSSNRRRYRKIDINANGRVSRAEFFHKKGPTRAAQRRFKKLDSNHDGSITELEFKTPVFNKKSNQRLKALQFTKFDINDDGVINIEESLHIWLMRFTRLDKNNDNIVTETEIKNTQQ